MQINIPIDGTTIAKLDGNKTYLTLLVGAIVIAANHYGLIPPQYVPQGLDPGHWIQDEYTLIIGAVFRSAMTKLAPPDVQKVAPVAPEAPKPA